MDAADRCDRCGARAVVTVMLGAGDLMFCRHHAVKFGFADEAPQTTVAATSGVAGESF